MYLQYQLHSENVLHLCVLMASMCALQLEGTQTNKHTQTHYQLGGQRSAVSWMETVLIHFHCCDGQMCVWTYFSLI